LIVLVFCMAAQKKAKIASAKGAKKKFSFDGKVIKPCLFVSKNKKLICAEYETGGLVVSKAGDVLSWTDVMADAKIIEG
jgi:hypothetical protein